MSKYFVINTFIDKETLKGYNEGDVYESKDSERIVFLQEQGFLAVESTSKESAGIDEDGLKHVGGGYYELPNGEKVQGKEKALEALKALETGE